MEARLIQGITREEYIALVDDDGNPLENQSKAKSAIKSAWHYFMKEMNPSRPEREETDNMLRGTLVHEFALEDKRRWATFEGTRRGRPWDNFQLKCERENLLSITKESGTINERDLLGCTASAKEALAEFGADADEECAVVFEQHGMNCKMLIDKLSVDGTIYDLKVTPYISKKQFEYNAFKPDFRYDFQSAWYTEGLRQALNLPMEPKLVFITIDPKYPYEWDAHQLHGQANDIARADIEKALNNLKEARETGDWSHKKRTPHLIVPPLSFFNDDED